MTDVKTKGSKPTKTRPFHETIVDAIARAERFEKGLLVGLLHLITATGIPAGHDEILAAINKYHGEPGSKANPIYAGWYREAKKHILAQKQAAAKKAEAATKAAGEKKDIEAAAPTDFTAADDFNLKALIRTTQALHNFLTNWHPHNLEWRRLVLEQLQMLRQLTPQAAGEKKDDAAGTPDIEPAAGAKKDIDLDELREDAKKLLVLLDDRQPTVPTWNEFLLARLQNLYRIISRALGK